VNGSLSSTVRRILVRLVSLVGSRLSHRQRRFVLDRLRLARVLGFLGRDQYAEIVLPTGFRATVNPLLHGHMAHDGKLAYEDDVLEALQRELGKGDVLYDVGANVGVLSLVAAERVGPTGAVHAFEPEANNLQCFRRSLDRWEGAGITLHDCAVGAGDGSMAFDRKGGAFSGRLLEAASPASTAAAVEVDVRAIDSIVAEGARPPALVKIDVEGGEGAVLEGAVGVLREHRPVVLCEMHPFNREGVERAFAVLDAAGYVCEDLDGAPVRRDDRPADQTFHVIARPSR
jgi:FkbM family methyltransferase